MTRFTSLILIAVVFMGLPVVTSANNDRMHRTMQVFSDGIDKLLLDTKHVYINVSHNVGSFYLEDSGAFFVGDISITATASMSIRLNEWSKFFTFDSMNKEDLELKEKELELKEEELKKLERELESLDEDAHTQKRIKDEDSQRIADMDSHLSEFKMELIQTVMDYGPIVKGLQSNEKIVVVLFVKDEIFFEKHKTKYLILSIPYSKIKEIQEFDAQSPQVKKAFEFNI